MQFTKWLFFGYVGLVVVMIAALGASFAVAPTRDPGTLYTAYGSNVKTLDPAAIGDTTSGDIAGNIFETLYNYDYTKRPYQIVPELAAGLPEVSKDGLTYTIKIKPGVQYYDPEKLVWPAGTGGEITAADFVYSFKRLADFHLATPNYSQLFEGKIAGLEAWRDYTKKTAPADIDWDRPVEGFEALDAHTLQIKLVKPSPQLLYGLAQMPTAPVSREAVRHWGAAIKHHPIGSGPYVLAENLPEQRIVFEANPAYRGRPEVEGGAAVPEADRLPRIKRLQLDYFQEALPSWALFQQGLLDVNGIPKDTFAQAIDANTQGLTPEMAAKGITLNKSPYPAIWYYGFNMDDPLVGKNKPLRQAMSMAFDRQAYINLFMNGRGSPAIGPIPPGFPTYDENLRNPYTELNLAAAKEKMKEAVKINGGPIPTIRLLLPGTDTNSRQTSEFMKRQMATIGLNIETEFVTWARFQEKIDGKQAQFYAMGWVADYPDEQTFLQLFWTQNVSPGPNSANYSNPQYDALYAKSAVMQPGPQRDAIYRKMQQIVMEDCPWILNFYGVSYSLYYDWVENRVVNDYAHGDRKYLELNSALRSKRLKD